MAFCEKCGAKLDDGQICECKTVTDQPQANPSPSASDQPNANQQQQPTEYIPTKAGNKKLYSILSYVGILRIIGLVVTPEKNDPEVKFHVGQGIMLTIAAAALSIAVSIVSAIINGLFRSEIVYFGVRTGAYQPSGFAIFFTSLLSFAVWVAIIVFAIIGILNANSGKQKPLPIIGKMAFYK